MARADTKEDWNQAEKIARLEAGIGEAIRLLDRFFLPDLVMQVTPVKDVLKDALEE